MLVWFDSQISPGRQRAALPQGYIEIRRDGAYWRVGAQGRLSQHAGRARTHAEAAGRQRPLQSITVQLAGRVPASFQRDLENTNLWMAVAGQRGGVRYQAHVLRVVGEGVTPTQWLPLVGGPGVPAYSNADDAMQFALVAAHQRLEADQRLAHTRKDLRHKTRLDADARFDLFAKAIEPARVPRAHRIQRNEIKAAQMLMEVGFTPSEVGRSLRIETGIVADMRERTLNDAHDKWVGQPSFTGARIREPGIRSAHLGAPPQTGDEITASLTYKHPKGETLFHARGPGRVTSKIVAANKKDALPVVIEKHERAGKVGWQCSARGQRLGRPMPTLKAAMHHAVDAAHEAMASGNKKSRLYEQAAAVPWGCAERPAMNEAARKRASARPIQDDSLNTILAADRAYRESKVVRHLGAERVKAAQAQATHMLGSITAAPRASTPNQSQEPSL